MKKILKSGLQAKKKKSSGIKKYSKSLYFKAYTLNTQEKLLIKKIFTLKKSYKYL